MAKESKYDERSAQAELMQAKRRKARDLVLPPVADPARRMACESDTYLFMDTYLSEAFDDKQPWTENRVRIVTEIERAIAQGGDKALAAPRGEGKSTICESLVGVKAIVTGRLRFPVIVAASGPIANQILDNIKTLYEEDGPFAEDYPEVCYPIKQLERAPQRARQQTIAGEFSKISWTSDAVVFPTVTLTWCPVCYNEGRESKGGLKCSRCGHEYKAYKSKASGAIIKTRGLDAAVRGLKIGSKRPDFVLIDDPDTEESAKSIPQTIDRERRIELALGGLGTTRKPVSRLMLTTISTITSVSAKYTDRKLKQSWSGDRLSLVKRWPDRKDLWERYIEIRHDGMEADPPDTTGRAATKFYESNREEMDRGCVVSNEFRFNRDITEDGTPRQLSTIQAVHDDAADKGWDYVFCELQNDPPEEETKESTHLSVAVVSGAAIAYRGRLSGLAEKVVPDTCEFVTAFVDVQHDRLYFEVVAWGERGRRHVVDYGVYGRDLVDRNIPLQDATMERIRSLKQYLEVTYRNQSGNPVKPDFVMIDSGDQTTTIYTSCLETGWMPVKGFGGNYTLPKQSVKGGKVIKSANGDPWHITLQQHANLKVKFISFDANEFKQRTKASWFVEPVNDPGWAIYIFGDDPHTHREYAKQICSAKFERWFEEGKGWKEKWIEGSDNHHWDTSVGNTLAHSVWTAFGKKSNGRSEQPASNQDAKRFTRPDGKPFLATER
jgi:hypothetical protein